MILDGAICAEHCQYLIHLVETERRFALLQLAHKPQTNSRFLGQINLRKTILLTLPLNIFRDIQLKATDRHGIIG